MAALPLPPIADWDTFPFEGDLRVRPLLAADRGRPAPGRRGGRRLLALPAR